MDKIIAKLRYFPLDAVAGPPLPIGQADLDKIGRETHADISVHSVVARNRTVNGDIIREDTMNSTIEEVTQDVITVSSGDDASFRSAIRSIIELYRAPRTIFGTWGSTQRGAEIVSELCDEKDGWY
jgi:hypothetical protein